MPLLTRKKVLTIDRNKTNALPTTLGNTNQAENIPIEAVASLDIERIERNFATGSLTSIKDLPGQKVAEFTFGLELKGSNNGTAEPQWARVLEGAGFRGEAIARLPIGAISTSGGGTSTTFRHGETITGTTSSATATVIMDTHNGSTEIYYDKSTLSGTFGTEVITGSDSLAQATTSAGATDEGYAYWPTSEVEYAVVVASDSGGGESVGSLLEGQTSGARAILSRAFTAGDSIAYFRPVRGTFSGSEALDNLTAGTTGDITLAASTNQTYTKSPPMGVRLYTDGKAVTGNLCRANVSFAFEVNRPVRMDFTYRGVLNSTTDATLLTGIDYENVDPPLWESSSIGYAANETASEADISDEIEPCIKTMSVDVGNTLTDRKCAGATSGLANVLISARAASGSLTVEDTLEADAAFLTRVQDGECVRLRATVGSTDGNRFTVSMPGMQFTGQSEGDDEGIVTQDMAFNLTGGNLYDLTNNTDVSSIGGDNEFVLIYHTA